MSSKEIVLGVTAGLIAIASSPMQAFASDSNYLANLAKYSRKDPGISNIVNQIGDANNIKMAKGICSVLDNPQVTSIQDLIGGVIKENFFEIPAPKLSGSDVDKSRWIGGFIGVTTLAGVPAYCSEHQNKVIQMFQPR